MKARFFIPLCSFWLTVVVSLPLAAHAQPQPLPAAMTRALEAAHIPQDAVAVWLAPTAGGAGPLLAHRASVPMNPASVMKLVTTFAALDTLGPTFTWRTPVWLDGTVAAGVLHGNLVIQGQGDPKLVAERLWLLLTKVQAMGVHRIEGDIVLDDHAFIVPATDPAEFDAEPLRPYNVVPDALLLNLKAAVLTFTPSSAQALARVQLLPPLQGLAVPANVPLDSHNPTTCGDYRSALKLDASQPGKVQILGSYPLGCGEKTWPLALPDPENFNARAIEGMWRQMGGELQGQVRTGMAPAKPASFEWLSPPLAEVVHDINKFSNNVMAQQVFLTLAYQADPSQAATPQAAREWLAQWWRSRIDAREVLVFDNGSGLSRRTRISAQALGRLLAQAWASPLMPDLMASLPMAGVDGTLRRSHAPLGSAHLKTGSLRDVLALAGYVHASQGRRWILVALINHANAPAGRPAFDALVQWAAAQ